VVGKRGRSQSETAGVVLAPGAPRIGTWPEDEEKKPVIVKLERGEENVLEHVVERDVGGSATREGEAPVGLGVYIDGVDWAQNEMQKCPPDGAPDSGMDEEMTEVVDEKHQYRIPLPLGVKEEDVMDDDDDVTTDDDDEEEEQEEDDEDNWMMMDPEIEVKAHQELAAIQAEFKEELDYGDTTMVAEYADEILSYMAELEVCFLELH
jgi:hypothetical protein